VSNNTTYSNILKGNRNFATVKDSNNTQLLGQTAPEPVSTQVESKVYIQKKEYKENSINTATPAKLVEMLYSGALVFLTSAKKALEEKKYSIVNEKIIRVEDIILELNISLDMEIGGEISQNLRALYTYIYKRLLEANQKKDLLIIEEVHGYISELRDTWVEAMKKEGNLAEKIPDPKRARFDIEL